MEKIFNSLVEGFIKTKVGIADNFLTTTLAAHLKDNLLLLHQHKQLYNAGTGNDVAAIQNKLVRTDKIYWLDRKHGDLHENAFLDLVDSFVQYLNRTCYSGITGYEFHYTLYEKGSFYKKHIDQFQNNGARAYSMILYLNADWVAADGGELCIHHDSHLQHISPDNGKGVFFKSSETIHEVLLANKARMSITGWFKVG
ncbi:MAG: 2OG-Fe(II) oxygenase [Mucilaginibacter sp.]